MNNLYCLKNVEERDMDLLMLNEFGKNPEFLVSFLKESNEYKNGKLKVNNPVLMKAYHSRVEAGYGESDLVIVYEDNGSLHALFIEDKINAIAQYRQAARYDERAQHAVSKGEFVDYCVFIVAPEKYINDSNPEAEVHKYINHMTYEKMLGFMQPNEYAYALIDMACNKVKSGYQAVRNDEVSLAWAEYKEYQSEFFKDLIIVQNTGDDKGGKISWIRYDVNIKNVILYHKPRKTDDYGTVELVFRIKPGKIVELKSYLTTYVGDFDKLGYEIMPCGKTQISIVKQVPYLNFRESMENQLEQLDKCLEVVRNMYSDIVKTLPKIATEQKLDSLKRLD